MTRTGANQRRKIKTCRQRRKRQVRGRKEHVYPAQSLPTHVTVGNRGIKVYLFLAEITRKKIGHFFCVILVVYPGRGIFHPRYHTCSSFRSFSPKSVFWGEVLRSQFKEPDPDYGGGEGSLFRGLFFALARGHSRE